MAGGHWGAVPLWVGSIPAAFHGSQRSRSSCTLSRDFVDANYVKSAQGDATDMRSAVRVVGQLKAEILEYR